MRRRDTFQNHKQEDDYNTSNVQYLANFGAWDVELAKDDEGLSIQKLKAPAMKIEKARIDLVPPEIMFGMAEAFEDGAAKRSERNWEVGSGAQSWSVRERVAAIQRHALKMMLGQRIDEVSGLHHAAHIAANAAMLYTAYIRGDIGDDDL